jgi:acetyl esterase/lipase
VVVPAGLRCCRCGHSLFPWRRVRRRLGARISTFRRTGRGAGEGVRLRAAIRFSARASVFGSVDEAQACYKGLVEKGFGKIALAGDSAGGGLALVLLSMLVAKARDVSALRPAGAAVMSPWTDLALSGTSTETRAEADPLLTKESLASAARLYLGRHDPRDPLASPLYGDLARLPQVRIHVGEDEVLLDDSLRYGERIEIQGGTVQIHTCQGMIHVFPSNVALLHAANEALDDIGNFLRQQLVGEPGDAGNLISRSTASIEGRLR